MQTFTDYEIIIEKVGSMPVTSNHVIKAAKGELVKVLYMDDYFAKVDSLQEIVDAFDEKTIWLATGCVHDDGSSVAKNYHKPSIEGIEEGRNTIGSPSVITFRRTDIMFFDEKLSWLLDLDLYARMIKKHGIPKIIDTPNVAIGIHAGQMTNILTENDKLTEVKYLHEKNKEKEI